MQISRAPDPIVFSGSILKWLQIFWVSSLIVMGFEFIWKPVFEASASSCRPPARPPSVGSCIALMFCVFVAVYASGTMLSFFRNFLAFSIIFGLISFFKSFSKSWASMLVPSIAGCLVRIISSPGSAPEDETHSFF